jgi:phage-related protein
MRSIIFYKTQSGKCPVSEFLDSLNSKQAKKVTWVLNLVENQSRVPIEYFKKLSGTSGLWEIRIQSGSDIFRLLGFMDNGKLVVLTNGFTKKSQKTPANEIQIAELRKTDYLQRKGEQK